MSLLTLLSFVTVLFFPLSIVSATPAPSPTTPPSVLLPRAAAQCNEDNCLRALRNHITSASAFCNTYTTSSSTATAGFPTYVPTTCGPSRVSSACSCAITKGPCATNAPTQVVQLPGFEMDSTAPSHQSTNYDGPWNATDTASRIFFVTGDAYEGTHFFHVWGFDSNQNGLYGINGVATLYQNISICPSSQYHFSFYVGWTGTAPYQASPGYAFNTTVAVYLNDALIVPTQLTCTDATQCNLPTVVNDTEAGYRLVTAPNLITPPPSGIGILKFVFIRASTAPGDPPLQDTILDYVTLTKVS